MAIETNPQLESLRAWLGRCGSALVAYSGGVDSALVMAVAHQVLGEKALACIGASASLPQREQRQAVELAQRLGAKLRILETHELQDANYAANPENRCYYCKSELFTKLREMAQAEHWEVLLDGTNADDLADIRAGRRAAAEQGVRSPLAELGISKAQVREMSHALGLPVWDKPAMACLSSRVPHGTAITPGLLQQIERAEDALAALGFRQFRVRHHGEVARIELPAADLARALAERAPVVAGIRAAGYKYICLDLAGFRSEAAPLPLTRGGQTVAAHTDKPLDAPSQA